MCFPNITLFDHFCWLNKLCMLTIRTSVRSAPDTLALEFFFLLLDTVREKTDGVKLKSGQTTLQLLSYDWTATVWGRG